MHTRSTIGMVAMLAVAACQPLDYATRPQSSGVVYAADSPAPPDDPNCGKLTKICGGTYPDCCVSQGLACGAAGTPHKNRCLPEADALRELEEVGGAMPTDDAPPPGTGTTTNVASPPFRPTYIDVNVLRKPGHHLDWAAGRTATQVGRHALQEYVTDVVLPEAIRYAETVPALASLIHFANGSIDVVTGRLGTNYMCKSICTAGGTWQLGAACCGFDRQYMFPYKSLIRFADASVQGAAAAQCAASPLMHDGLAQTFNLHIDTGADGVRRCVKGNADTLAFMARPKLEAFNPKRALDGLVSNKKVLPSMKLDDKDRALLHATHVAHKWSTQRKIGLGVFLTDDDKQTLMPWVPTSTIAADFQVDPPVGLTSTIHQLYEGRCSLPGKGGETCHHLRRMMDFSGAVAPYWGAHPEDRAVILLLEDVAHERWMMAQLQIGVDPMVWCKIVGEDNNHRNAHVASALGHPEMLVLPYRDDCQEACGKRTVQQWINENRGLLSRLAPPMQLRGRSERAIAIPEMRLPTPPQDEPVGSPVM